MPHASFTFAKLWVHAAHLEVRLGGLGAARKILGNAIGRCPKQKLFREYIQLELQLGEVPRCRELYQRYLQWAPDNCAAWIAFAELEASLGELERARAIFGLAVEQPSLDMPEALWKAAIDLEIEQGDAERTRTLYRRLLDRTTHVKVWISFAKFEAEGGGNGVVGAADIFLEAEEHFKAGGQREERALLLDAWREMEASHGDEDRVALVDKRMPKRLKKKRPLRGDDGEQLGWEEYIDYTFPEEQAKAPSLKILEMAHKWKRRNGGADD